MTHVRMLSAHRLIVEHGEGPLIHATCGCCGRKTLFVVKYDDGTVAYLCSRCDTEGE